jgi:geranylgeranyl diphosphate synthase type II
LKTTPFDLGHYLGENRRRINNCLLSLLPPEGASRLHDAVRYSLMAGGKRIRPILCIAAAEASGTQDDDVLRAGCALEMVHTYSLVHDDLPAMDDDDLRRGRPTCHRAFDDATAVLAGDALLTMGLELLADTAGRSAKDPRLWLDVIGELTDAAGPRGMIEGQMRDMAAEQVPVDMDSLTDLHRLKTGRLIRASVRMGSMLAGADPDTAQHLESYGDRIGLAFQVTDDILNVTGDPDIMGKAAGTDTIRNKSTYPSLMGLEASKRYAEDLVTGALRAMDNFDNRAEPLRAIARYILERKR